MAAQTGINSFFINYVTEKVPTVSSRTAALLLSFGGMGLFFVGRLLGSWLMNRIQASKVLLACAIGGILCMAYVILGSDISALVALVLTYLCEAPMFPTIFALSLLHRHRLVCLQAAEIKSAKQALSCVLFKTLQASDVLA